MGLSVHSPRESIVILISFCPRAWSICHVPSGKQLTHPSYYGPWPNCEVLKALPCLPSRMNQKPLHTAVLQTTTLILHFQSSRLLYQRVA